MSTSTLDAVDASAIESIEVPCEVMVAFVRRNRRGAITAARDPRPCGKPARFAGVIPCCGSPVLACEPHATDGEDFYCPPCSQSTPSHRLNWQRI